MTQNLLISVETQQDGKAPNLLHITYRKESLFVAPDMQGELLEIVKKIIGNPNLNYRIVNVTQLTDKQYEDFLKGQIADWLRGEPSHQDTENAESL